MNGLNQCHVILQGQTSVCLLSRECPLCVSYITVYKYHTCPGDYASVTEVSSIIILQPKVKRKSGWRSKEARFKLHVLLSRNFLHRAFS